MIWLAILVGLGPLHRLVVATGLRSAALTIAADIPSIAGAALPVTALAIGAWFVISGRRAAAAVLLLVGVFAAAAANQGSAWSLTGSLWYEAQWLGYVTAFVVGAGWSRRGRSMRAAPPHPKATFVGWIGLASMTCIATVITVPSAHFRLYGIRLSTSVHLSACSRVAAPQSASLHW